MSEKVNQLVTSIKELQDDERNMLMTEVIAGSSVLWLSTFVKALEQKFGVSAAAPMMAMPAAGAAAAAPQAEEKTAFDVILKDGGANKIQAIKVVRAVTSLGLKEAKDLVEGAPKPVKTGVTKEEAQKVVKELEAVGAKCEIA
ncbi:MAG: 50S ribosomal protein L7/L12 [Planctomycetes bacterium]|nr:50S ribosomal protein L7/L12 [Planctomycetota bacterium]